MKAGPISISNLRSALAFGLVLWCAGTGCLAHGLAMSGSAAVAGSKSASGNQSQMAMTGHACCKARHRALRSARTAESSSDEGATFTLPEGSSSGVNSCCPLTSGSFVLAPRDQNNNENTSTLTQPGGPAQAVSLSFRTSGATLLRLPNHEQTYLTCCAFLI